MHAEAGAGDNGHEALPRIVPLRPIKSAEGLDAAITLLNALADRRASLTPGEMDYFVVLALIVEHREGLIYPDPKGEQPAVITIQPA